MERWKVSRKRPGMISPNVGTWKELFIKKKLTVESLIYKNDQKPLRVILNLFGKLSVFFWKIEESGKYNSLVTSLVLTTQTNKVSNHF